MTKPNPAQRVLLEQAARTADGVIGADGVAKATVSALVRKGWLIVMPAPDGPNRLLITAEGRAAAGVPTVKLPSQRESKTEVQPAAPKSKLDAVADLLAKPAGATIEALMAVTGWQAHSVRGAIAGALKKRGLVIQSEKTEHGRLYRIVQAAQADA